MCMIVDGEGRTVAYGSKNQLNDRLINDGKSAE